MAVADRVLPHDLEAERAVLGAVLVGGAERLQAIPWLRPEDCFRDAHARILRALRRLAERGVAPDLLTLRAELDRAGDLEAVGGPSYVAALVDGVPRSAHVAHYAEVVRAHARRRQVIAVANRLLEDAYEGEDSAEAVAGRATAALGSLYAEQRRPALTADEAVAAYLDTLGKEGSAYPTGLVDVDALTGGLRPREVTVIGARTSVGKSSLALGVAAHLAAAGHAVEYFSPEMSCEAQAARLVGWQVGVPSAAFERNEATPAEWAALGQAMTAYAGLPLRIHDSVRRLDELVALCRQRQAQAGLAAVFVDYLQLLVLEKSGRSREEDVAALSGGLKALAKELGVAVVALAQLRRVADDRRDKRPTLADLRESGAIEQDADLALLLYREEMHQPKPENAGLAEVIVAKQRNGPTGVVRVCFDKRLARFLNLAPEYGT